MYSNFQNFLFLFFGLILFVSCANSRLHKVDISNIEEPTGEISHTMFLIGDAGEAGAHDEADNSKANQAVSMLKYHLKDATENSTVLFLGDNIYPKGLPPESAGELHDIAIGHLDIQMKAVEGYKGYPIFMPGNHDWAKYNLQGLNRQENHIEEGLNESFPDKVGEHNYFMPDGGCAGPEVLEINEKLVLLIIDSHWWIMRDKHAEIGNKDCAIQTREELTAMVRQEVEKHKGKNIVFAAHHPFRTYGSHGGYYTIKDHLFPVTMYKKNFYLPLPVLGSLIVFIRGSGVIRQDLRNKHYRSLSRAMVGVAKEYGELIFISGHDHNLQYIQDEGQHFVVSGAGSKVTPTARGKNGLFTYGHNGFSKIDFYEDGSAWIEFWIPDDKNEKGEKVFRYKMKDALSKKD